MMKMTRTVMLLALSAFSLFNCTDPTNAVAPAGRAWGDPREIFKFSLANFSSTLDMAADGNGNIFAAGNFFAKRYIDGVGWYMNEEMDINQTEAMDIFRYPKAVENRSGTIGVLWSDFSYNVYANVYTAAGNWAAPSDQKLSTGQATVGIGLLPDENDISAEIDETGNIIAAWEEAQWAEPYTAHIQAARYTTGGNWTRYSIPGSELGQINCPKVFFTAGGRALAVWLLPAAGYKGVHIYGSSFDPAAGWTNAALMETISADVDAFRMETGKDGNGNIILILWFQDEIWSLTYSAAAGWDGARQIYATSNTLDSSFGCHFRMNENGEGCLVWTEIRQQVIDKADIMSMQYSSSSGWGSAEAIDNTIFPVTRPRVEMDGAGNILALWVQEDDMLRYYLYGRLKPKGGAWQNREKIDGGVLASGISRYQVKADSKGNFTVIWEQLDYSTEPDQVRFFANRLEYR